MMETDVEKAIDEILGRVDADRETVEKDLKKFIEYGVPLDQAKEAVVTKYGGVAHERQLKDITPHERNINVVAKILTVEEREVTVRDTKRTIHRGLLGDETAVLPFTAWKDFNLQKGDVVRIKNASSSEWDGQPRLSLSEWSEVEKLDRDIEPVQRTPQKLPLADLRPGLSNVEVRGKILSMEEREVTVGDVQKRVFSGIMADETGKIRYSAWHDFSLHEGDVIRIRGAYVRKWRGAPQLVFDEKSTVEKLDEAVAVRDMVLPLYKIVEAEGGVDVLTQGTVIEIRKDSGIIFRCPRCNRKIRDGVCEEDGEVQGVEDLRIKAVIDDGTGAVDVIFNRELSEKLLGKTLEEYLAIAREAMDYEVVHDEIVDRLLMVPIQIRGDSIPSDFIITLFAREAEPLQLDYKKEADEILSQLEG